MSDIMEGNRKIIKEIIYNGVKDYTTTSDYVLRREIPAIFFYEIW